MFKLSILISSYKRLEYLRRTLYSIKRNEPFLSYEVVIVDEESDESSLILEELRSYDFNWKYIKYKNDDLESLTGLKKYYNCPVLAYNIGLKHSSGQYLATIGNDIIIFSQSLNNLLYEGQQLGDKDFILYSTTYQCPKYILDRIGDRGQDITWSDVTECSKFVMQSKQVKALVNNYLSLTPKKTLNKIQGWRTSLFESIAADDSDVSRRIMAIPGSYHNYLDNVVSLHQEHPSSQKDNVEFWNEGVRRSRLIYNNWDGNYVCEQEWPITYDRNCEIITNYNK